MQASCLVVNQDIAQELEDRNKFLEALADKYTVSGLPEPGPLPELAPLPEDEAIILIQANERGRQARERAQTMRTFKRQRQLEDRRARSGVVRPSSCCVCNLTSDASEAPTTEVKLLLFDCVTSHINCTHCCDTVNCLWLHSCPCLSSDVTAVWLLQLSIVAESASAWLCHGIDSTTLPSNVSEHRPALCIRQLPQPGCSVASA